MVEAINATAEPGEYIYSANQLNQPPADAVDEAMSSLGFDGRPGTLCAACWVEVVREANRRGAKV